MVWRKLAVRAGWLALLLVSLEWRAVAAAAAAAVPLSWQKIEPSLGSPTPAGRRDATLAYDAPRNRLILFGGRDGAVFSDTWLFHLDTNVWELVNATVSPPGRFSLVSGLDLARDRLLITMGEGLSPDSSRIFFNDVWQFHLLNHSWSAVETRGDAPRPRYGSVGGIWRGETSAEQGDVLLLSHGFAGVRYSDTWLFHLTNHTWEEITPPDCWPRWFCRPRARCLHAGVLFGPRDLLLYAGCSSKEGPCPLSDTWLLNASAAGSAPVWSYTDYSWLRPLAFYSRAPPPRAYSFMASGNGKSFWVYDGLGATGPYGDGGLAMFNLSSRTWSSVVPVGASSPGPRLSYNLVALNTSCCSQLGAAALVLFGGSRTTTSPGLAELWMLAGEEASSLSLYGFSWGRIGFPLGLALLVLLPAAGLLVTRCYPRARLAQWLLYTRVGTAPLKQPSCAYFVLPMLDLTWSEVCLVCSFLLIESFWFALFYTTSVSEQFARACGWLNLLNLGLLLLPVARHSLWLYVFGISFERAIRFHRWLARWTISIVSLHFAVMLIHYLAKLWDYDAFAFPPVFGFIAWCFLIIVFVTALERYRRKHYQLFLATHRLYIVVLTFAFLHQFLLGFFLIPGVLLHLLDKLIRLKQSRLSTVSLVSATLYGNVMHLELEKKSPRRLEYRAGQFVFLCVPAISSQEWHPFSLSSAPDDQTFSCHIRDMGMGTWTGRLARLDWTSGHPTPCRILMEGPYGKPAIEASEYNAVLLVAGGIGVTPIISMLLDFAHSYRRGDLRHEKIAFIWTVADASILTPFQARLEFISTAVQEGAPFQLAIHITRATSTSLEGGPPAAAFRLEQGRPSYEAAIAAMCAADMKGPLAVFCCGPPSMVADVQRSAALAHTAERVVHFHKEVFEF